MPTEWFACEWCSQVRFATYDECTEHEKVCQNERCPICHVLWPWDLTCTFTKVDVLRCPTCDSVFEFGELK